jgi:ATP-dependent DNA ligase
MRLRKLPFLDRILYKFDADELALQVKDDGFKLFAVKSKAGKVMLYTRRGKSVTAQLQCTRAQRKFVPG